MKEMMQREEEEGDSAAAEQYRHAVDRQDQLYVACTHCTNKCRKLHGSPASPRRRHKKKVSSAAAKAVATCRRRPAIRRYKTRTARAAGAVDDDDREHHQVFDGAAADNNLHEDHEPPRAPDPTFIKTVMPTTVRSRNCELHLPAFFFRSHGNRFQKFVLLRGPSGQVWPVNLCVSCGSKSGRPTVRFARGWKAFALDHGLDVGDELVFTLIAFSRFSVAVLDGAGNKKTSSLMAISGWNFRREEGTRDLAKHEKLFVVNWKEKMLRESSQEIERARRRPHGAGDALLQQAPARDAAGLNIDLSSILRKRRRLESSMKLQGAEAAASQDLEKTQTPLKMVPESLETKGVRLEDNAAADLDLVASRSLVKSRLVESSTKLQCVLEAAPSRGGHDKSCDSCCPPKTEGVLAGIGAQQVQRDDVADLNSALRSKRRLEPESKVKCIRLAEEAKKKANNMQQQQQQKEQKTTAAARVVVVQREQQRIMMRGSCTKKKPPFFFSSRGGPGENFSQTQNVMSSKFQVELACSKGRKGGDTSSFQQQQTIAMDKKETKSAVKWEPVDETLPYSRLEGPRCWRTKLPSAPTCGHLLQSRPQPVHPQLRPQPTRPHEPPHPQPLKKCSSYIEQLHLQLNAASAKLVVASAGGKASATASDKPAAAAAGRKAAATAYGKLAAEAAGGKAATTASAKLAVGEKKAAANHYSTHDSCVLSDQPARISNSGSGGLQSPSPSFSHYLHQEDREEEEEEESKPLSTLMENQHCKQQHPHGSHHHHQQQEQVCVPPHLDAATATSIHSIHTATDDQWPTWMDIFGLKAQK
ncbi:unnamed protein product [Sphagnum balticum]